MINIFVSGDRRTVAGDTTIEKLLIAEKVEMPEYVSVSVNEQFIAKEEFSSFVLRDGDVVEFLYYMGGAGAKMIRAIMKNKGVSSLEELIESAINHGVRPVACQMSMDIMGIRKEELIDGVELGGVSTFLGSGEKSDMSLFI